MSDDWIKWPEGWRDSGENGLYVYFVVPALMDDPMVLCSEADQVILWEPPGVITTPTQYRPKFSDPFVLAAVMVESTEGCPIDMHGQLFWASKDDLGKKAVALYAVLAHLYKRDPYIMTFLDT